MFVDYTTNFNFVLDTTKKQWNLELTHDLSVEILKLYTELILTITATEANNDKSTGKSTLIIYLYPSNNENYLNFSSTYYEVEYEIGSDKLDVTIELSSNQDLENVTPFLISEYLILIYEKQLYISNIIYKFSN